MFIISIVFSLLIFSSELYCHPHYEDQLFLARITAIDDYIVRKIAKYNGFEIERKLLSFDDVYIGRKQKREPRKKRDIEYDILEQLLLNHKIDYIEKLQNFKRFKRESINWNSNHVHVWNLKPSMYIKDAWEKGYNAKNQTIAIIDDGVDVNHIDLQSSFSPDVSFDFVRFESLARPVSGDEQFEHGTQCAGLVSMVGNQCGLGVGYGATLGAIRLLGNDMLNDALEGEAIAFQKDLIDIYSLSWGPKDDGQTAEKPAKFTQMAIEHGALYGRKGKGNIYVWASGNGGLNDDNCALDGYVNNENTISLGVIGSDGSPTLYAEGCSAVIAAVSGGDSMIHTTGTASTCSSITGSSALTAIASGIIALALQANPTLTQRDIQHLIVKTADPEAIKNINFTTNSAGLKFHPKVGFGLLNALKMVDEAEKWKNVGDLKICEVSNEDKVFSSEKVIEISVDSCDGIKRIERASVHMDLIHPKRGKVQMYLQSPHGTISEILAPRSKDSSLNLIDWNFVSTNFFNESFISTKPWKIYIQSNDSSAYQIKNLKLRLTGN